MGFHLAQVNIALPREPLGSVLLADFDFRRPIVHTLFGVDRSPGLLFGNYDSRPRNDGAGGILDYTVNRA